MRFLSKICLWILIGLFFIVFSFVSDATPEYAEQTGFECRRCHTDATGGELTKAGQDFREGLRVKGRYRPLGPSQRMMRLVIGYVHLLTAIAWFGTILYVHILLKPAYAAKGLPKGELILGWLGIALLSMTGVPLTIARIPTWEAFYTTRFGILLGIKIILFLVMVTSAAVATFVIGPKLRKRSAQAPLQKGTRFTLEALSQFNGSEKRPAYIAYKGKIYDVTASRLWVEGNHVRKHLAGNDLTEALRTAPHGEDKILGMPFIGELIISETKIQKPAHEKVFYFMAYMNLIFVFLITFVIALWKWG